MQKKLWVYGSSSHVDIGTDKPLKLKIKYKSFQFEPICQIGPIDANPRLRSSIFDLMKYLPANAMDCIEGYTTFNLFYTDNEERVKVGWFKDTTSHLDHLKKLSEFKLLTIDKRNMNKIDKFYLELEKHREKHPELWI